MLSCNMGLILINILHLFILTIVSIHIAGDNFLYPANGRYQFSTFDRDVNNCAALYTGAWWYWGCLAANLNGRYLYGQHDQPYAQGMIWSSWRGLHFSLKMSEMKLRPVP